MAPRRKPSWNSCATTDKASPKYVPPEERIATFDEDGTTWVEHPMYTEVVFSLDRVVELAPKHPEWKDKQPFKAVIDRDREAMAKFTLKNSMEIVVATHTGVSTDEFDKAAKEWIAKAKHPRWKRPYTDLVYQPMLEVMRYLRANGYKTYIVTGGTQPFVRAFASEDLWHSAGADHRHDGQNQVHAHQGRQRNRAGPENAAQQQLCRQGGGYLSLHRPPAQMRRSATRPAISRCWSTTRPAAVRGSACSCCTTMRTANMHTARPHGLPDTKVGAFSQSCTTKPRKAVGLSSA